MDDKVTSEDAVGTIERNQSISDGILVICGSIGGEGANVAL